MCSKHTWEQLNDLEDRVNAMHPSKVHPLTVVAALDTSTIQALQERYQGALNDAGDANEELGAAFDVVDQRCFIVYDTSRFTRPSRLLELLMLLRARC